MKETAGLTDEEADALNQMSAKMSAFLKALNGSKKSLMILLSIIIKK